MLVYDRQPNRAFPAIGDVLFDAPAGVVYYGSGVNMVNKSRFHVLRDLRIQLDPLAAESAVFHTYTKCRLETEFAADGGTVGDIATGAIYLIAFTGVLTGAGVISMRNVITRIRYYD